MASELSAEQLAVLSERSPRFVVQAAAGSGKTRVLVARYLQAIDDGLSPDEILAVTFTRKAAYDMRRRVVTELLARGRTADARLAETGPICTLHSFCDRLLRENALVAGVDPDFDHLGDVNESEAIQRAIRETLAELALGEDAAADLIAESLGKASWGGRLFLEGGLLDIVREGMRMIRGSGHELEDLERLYDDPDRVRSAFAAKMRASMTPEQMMVVGDSDLVGAYARFKGKHARSHRPKWLCETDEAKERAAAERSCGLMRIVLESWRRYESMMIARQEFDQTEIEGRAVRLIATDHQVACRLREQYRCVLVDEAQDLNPLQYRLLESLACSREMMVGDGQQSIYRFREAERGYFIERARSMKCLTLSVNYRSAPGILRFVGRLFCELWKDDYVHMRHPSALVPDPSREQDRSPFEDEFEHAAEAVEWWPQADHDPKAVAALIHQLIVEGEPPKDVAVLTRTGDYGERLQKELIRQGVAAELHGQGHKFYTRLEVRDLANVLRALADPSDDFALLCVLHGPMVGLSYDAVVMLAARGEVLSALEGFEPLDPADAERIATFLDWYRELAALADRLPAWEMLAEVTRRTPFLAAIAARPGRRQALANVRKLLARAARQPELRPREFAEQIANVLALRHREGDAPIVDRGDDAVTIMTIHSSKGLEFPVVVVPETLKAQGRNKSWFLVDRPSGLAAWQTPSSLAYYWLAERERRLESEEELRLLYVACTRAQRRLCLVVPARRSDARDALGGIIVRTMGDWKSPPNGVKVRRSDR
jgi:ATP-dependent exoDNAse (exonuclease V) beta subunit